MPKLRILVVDDHALIRQGIVALLNAQHDMEVVGEAEDGQGAIKVAIRVTPDIVLMDIGMPGINGLDATRGIKKQLPGAQVLILTVHDREDYFFQALRAGADGYILKGADTRDLLAAIHSLSKGDVYFAPMITKKLLADYIRGEKSAADRSSYDGLTEREREIVRLIAEGMTTREVAKILYLSPHTVSTHRDNIMKKLNLHRKADLIRYAIKRGLVDAEM